MRICFETFGCRLSRAEALDDEAKCLSRGHVVVDSHEEADLVVVRGCSVTAKAQKDCERLIRHIRDKYPDKRVFVTGCIAGAKKFSISGVRAEASVPTRTARAYLKVQDGCDGRCSFCIVPQFRGAAVSVPFETAVDRAKHFLDAGYREIVVTGCNLSLYRSHGRRLPELVASLADLDAGCRVRIGSVEPGIVAETLVQTMAGLPNVCRFLHVPVQSGSDAILARMRRPYRVRHVESLFARARELLPGLAIGCDMMSGFPGETDIDHMDSVLLMKRESVVNIHAFPYSERPQTAAAEMSGRVEPSLRSLRAKALASVAKFNRAAYARAFVGRDVRLVVETHHGEIAGWTDEYLWFECRSVPGPLRHRHLRKSLLTVRVTEAKDGRLYGEPA